MSTERRFVTPNKRGVYDILGMQVDMNADGSVSQKGWEQMDEVLSIYRDKSCETFRYLFIGPDGKIRNQIALTAQLPDVTLAYPNSEFLREVKSYAAATNSRIIFVHNHPNGNPNPSDADIETTKSIGDFLNEGETNIYGGHIILDHGKYTASCPDIEEGKWLAYSTDEAEKDDPLEKKTVSSVLGENYLTKEKIREIGREVSGKEKWNTKGWVSVVFTHGNAVVQVKEYRTEYLETASSTELKEELRLSGAGQGANHAVPFVLSENTSPRLLAAIKEHAKNGCFLDVYYGGQNLADVGLAGSGNSFLTDTEINRAKQNIMVDSTIPLRTLKALDPGGIIREKKNKGEKTMEKETVKIDINRGDQRERVQVFDAEILPGMTASPVFADTKGNTGRFSFATSQTGPISQTGPVYNKPGIDLMIQKNNAESFSARLVEIAEGSWHSEDLSGRNDDEQLAIKNYADKTNGLLKYLKIERNVYEPLKVTTTIRDEFAEKISEEEKTAFDLVERSDEWKINKEQKSVYIDGKIFRMYELQGNNDESRGFRAKILVSEAALRNKNGGFVEEFAKGYAAAAEYFTPEWEVNGLAREGGDRDALLSAGEKLKESLKANSQRMLATVWLHKQNAMKGADKDEIGKEFLRQIEESCPVEKLFEPNGEQAAYEAARKARAEILSYKNGDQEQRAKSLDKFLLQIGIEDPAFQMESQGEARPAMEKARNALARAINDEKDKKKNIIEKIKSMKQLGETPKKAPEKKAMPSVQKTHEYERER